MTKRPRLGDEDVTVLPPPNSVSVPDQRVVLFDAEGRPLTRQIGYRVAGESRCQQRANAIFPRR